MPSERIVQGYKRLFELRLLHHYWLDDGDRTFDLQPEIEQTQRLLTYDVRPFLNVVPTESTLKTLSGIRAIFRQTPLGAVVAVPNDVLVSSSAIFEFRVLVTNADFYSYTALTLSGQRVVGLLQEKSGRTITFKENVAVYSNLTGVTRGVEPLKVLFLSKEYLPISATDGLESIGTSGGALVQLTSSAPNPTSKEVAAIAADAPVYTHQGDVPAIVDPTDMVGVVPTNGITLTDEIGADTFAVIRIAAVRGDNSAYDCISPSGTPRQPHPVFQIRFKNRSATWRYVDKRNSDAVPVSRGPLPLTFNGNATAEPKETMVQQPSVGTVKIVTSSNGINTLVSDVFI